MYLRIQIGIDIILWCHILVRKRDRRNSHPLGLWQGCTTFLVTLPLEYLSGCSCYCKPLSTDLGVGCALS